MLHYSFRPSLSHTGPQPEEYRGEWGRAAELETSFLVKVETKMDTEHDVLTANSHDGLPCTVLLSLGLRLFPDELAFYHTIRLDNHNLRYSEFTNNVPLTPPAIRPLKV